ncbi:GDP-L-fucose synthase [Candidatus Woesearchaeota archaeon]|nr:GDP-L-fucose synthase [Candidatus Woesearchaeota archaeon]MCF7900807.1 GDP-L-fucose synthase [Candidatus Woesearchaeota archaeon]MCF8013109.1 GDP-L-fucose synthase [Candidatus Woesearchaeota archaeon]
MEKNSKITVFGGTGLLGSAIVKRLKAKGYQNIDSISSKEINLLEKKEVEEYLKNQQPDQLFMVAGHVGGIYSNMKRGADFLYKNTTMALNVFESIKNYSKNTKILFTGSTCIYPKENPQPINEDRFLAGKLEKTNIGYAIAKITGIIASELYTKQYGLKTIAVMPTNLYGPNDNYDLENGHMIPGLIKKFYDAKQNNNTITLWGSGKPRREALFSEDCADVCIYLMKNYDGSEIINIGTGFDYSITEFADKIKKVLDFEPKIEWDTSKPDGTFEKRTDITRLKKIMPEYKPRSFEEGLKIVLEYDF